MFPVLFVLVFACQMNAEKIDWDSALTETLDEFQDSLNNGRVREMVHRVFAPGFVAITPYGVIKGSFEALEKSYSGHFESGRRVQDIDPVILMTFGKYALEWHHYVTKDSEGKVVETGLSSVVLEYIDGQAKVILSHFSPEVKENNQAKQRLATFKDFAREILREDY